MNISADRIRISVIAARARNGVIGYEGKLPWRLKSDLTFFKHTTLNKPIIMGRKTWDSLPNKPLPKRSNIILSRNSAFQADGAHVYTHLDFALGAAKSIAAQSGQNEICIIGGEMIYKMALHLANRIYLTEVAADIAGDAYFPQVKAAEWQEISSQSFTVSEADAFDFTIRVLERSG